MAGIGEFRTLRNFLIILLLIILILYMFIPKPKPTVDKKDAISFVLEDLRHKYGNASLSIANVVKKKNELNETYYEIKAKVILYPKTPCPELFYVYYNYPEQNFVPQPPEKITTDACRVCENEICTLLYPEEAVIASHTLPGTSKIAEYINRHPKSTYYVARILRENTSVWAVNWSDKDGTYIYVELHENGSVVKILP